MSDRPSITVSFEAVQFARTEVAAYEAAGMSDEIDPMVRRIAEAKAVSSVEKK